MRNTKDFGDFVTARSHGLLQLAFLLTRDHALAEDLLQTALAKSWTVWHKLDGNPEPYVRRILINTHSSWWRRRWTSEVPSEVLPEPPIDAPQGKVDDHDEVWRALAKLPRRQRAVLVLRYFEDLTETQIAEIMAISASAVRSYATKALAKLRLDPTLHTLPLPAPLEVPESTQRLAAVRHRIAAGRRRKIASAAAAVAFLAIFVAGLVYWKRPATPPINPSPSPFPSYSEGYKTALFAEMSFAEAGKAFTFTPSNLDWRIWPMCGHDAPNTMVMVNVRVNGISVAYTSCDDRFSYGPSTPLSPAHESLAQAGVVAGQPVKVTVTIGDPHLRDGDAYTPGGQVPALGKLGVVFREKVTFENYPLPDPPPSLQPLPTSSFYIPPGQAWIRSSQPYLVRWQSHMSYTVRSQTPGRIHIKVNGKAFRTVEIFDYKQGQTTVNFDAASDIAQLGTDVTVTVETEYVTGDWLVTIGPGERPSQLR